MIGGCVGGIRTLQRLHPTALEIIERARAEFVWVLVARVLPEISHAFFDDIFVAHLVLHIWLCVCSMDEGADSGVRMHSTYSCVWANYECTNSN